MRRPTSLGEEMLSKYLLESISQSVHVVLDKILFEKNNVLTLLLYTMARNA